jgi:hypothetical protein
MKDIEIAVFKDKVWVRLIEYQKLKDRYEALEETKEYQNDEICRLQKQIEKIGDFIQAGDLCSICKFENKCNPNECFNQNIRVYTKWELAE